MSEEDSKSFKVISFGQEGHNKTVIEGDVEYQQYEDGCPIYVGSENSKYMFVDYVGKRVKVTIEVIE